MTTYAAPCHINNQHNSLQWNYHIHSIVCILWYKILCISVSIMLEISVAKVTGTGHGLLLGPRM